MKSAIRYFLFTGIMVVLTAPMVLGGSVELAKRLMVSSLVIKQVNSPSTRVNGILNSFRSSMNSDQYEAFKKEIEKPYLSDVIEAKTIDSFVNDYTDEELLQLINWFEGPVGRRLIEAELNAGLNATGESRNKDSQINENNPEGNLVTKGLVEKLLKQLRIVEEFTEFSLKTTISAYLVRNSIVSNKEQTGMSAIKKRLEGAWNGYVAKTQSDVFQSMYDIYKHVSVSDFEAYINFLNSSVGMKFHKTVSEAFFDFSYDNFSQPIRASDIELYIVAAQSKEVLPKVLNKEFRLDKIEAAPRTLIYYFTMTNQSSEQVDSNLFKNTMKEVAVPNSCNGSSSRVFLDAGITLKNIYLGSDGGLISVIDITPELCTSLN